MRYLWSVLFPPVAMLLSGKVIQSVLCLLLMVTVVGWIPAAIWAWGVSSNYYANRRQKELIKAMRRNPR